jgi:SacI homology domain
MGGPWHYNKGLNEYGNVANCVESEIIMIKHVQDDSHIKIIDYYSFTQLRGSIPLFWSNDSQTGKPRLDRTIESTSEIFMNHKKAI